MGGEIVVGLALALGFYMAFSIGANDAANAMGTSVGSGALTLRQAILVAAVLEFLGAFLVGGHVTQTIRGGILDPEITANAPDDLIYGMLAALTAAGTWLIFASRLGWPVSTTHSIVGAIAGFGVVSMGIDAVEWGKLGRIVISWGVSPLISGTISFLVFTQIRRTILDREDRVARMRLWGPAHAFLVVAVIALVTLFKGLKHLHLDFSFPAALGLATLLGGGAAGIAALLLRRSRERPVLPGESPFVPVERMFAVLQILSACAVAFAHGSNDVANAIGPVAAILSASGGEALSASSPVPPQLLLIGGIGIVLGLSLLGYRVMATIGAITDLTPTRGYAAELAAALTIVLASRMGIPVSTTHVLVGAVLGVGLARGIGALDYRVVGKIALSWIVTLPVGAGLAIFFYYFYKGLLGSLGGL